MVREEAFNLTALIYQEYYRQVTLNQDYVFELDEAGKKKKVINKFLDFVDEKYSLKSIGLEYLVNFIESGFNLYFDAKHLKYGVRSIQIEWIIGSKAIERYEKIKDIDNKYFRKNRKIRQDIKLRVLDKFKHSSLPNRQAIKQLLTDGNVEFYEAEKQRFYDTAEGLAWCMLNTTLYNHKSSLCEACTNRNKCKQILGENYPKLYQLRGYGK
jgi:hypothetical protein